MSVINLDEVGTLCLPSCLSLSPNLVVNDPFPLFSQPIFYPLDHVQYGCFFMQMSGGWSGGGNCEQSETDCLPPCTVEKLRLQQKLGNKRERCSLVYIPHLAFILTSGTDVTFCHHCGQQFWFPKRLLKGTGQITLGATNKWPVM